LNQGWLGLANRTHDALATVSAHQASGKKLPLKWNSSVAEKSARQKLGELQGDDGAVKPECGALGFEQTSFLGVGGVCGNGYRLCRKDG